MERVKKPILFLKGVINAKSKKTSLRIELSGNNSKFTVIDIFESIDDCIKWIKDFCSNWKEIVEEINNKKDNKFIRIKI